MESSILSPNMAIKSEPAGMSSESSIPIPVLPRAFESRKEWIVKERIQAVQRYAHRSMKDKAIPAADAATMEWLARIDRLLNFLEHELEITPRYQKEAQIDRLLKFIFEDARFYFPPAYKERASALYDDFVAKEWGASSDSHDIKVEEDEGASSESHDIKVEEDEEQLAVEHHQPHEQDQRQKPVAKSRTTAGTSAPQQDAAGIQVAHIYQPPADHPIWGVKGIMHGVVPKLGGKLRTLVLDRRYMSEKRPANVPGHNGLRVGDWFPYQLSALFYGAHGARMAGIAGNASYGAFSIVVAATYEDIDEDRGDTIIYSGPRSLDNTDPKNPPNPVLAQSLRTGNPVRVLRSAARKSSESVLAPGVGIRYDGLYKVTSQKQAKQNSAGGVYWLFVLKRLRDQGQELSLEEIANRSPTFQQKIDFSKIWQLW